MIINRVKFVKRLMIMAMMLNCFILNSYAIEMGYAIDFKAGQYYFDNTKLHFTTVKMVLGYNGAVIVCEMTPLPDKDWWSLTIEEEMMNLDGFCFIDSNTAPGDYDMSIDDFMNSLQSQENGLRQTRLRNSLASHAPSLVGWVFYPLNDEEISDGYWRPQDSYDAIPSETLPIIHVNTQNSQMILDKEDYINGTFWLDNCGIEEFQSIGSEDDPVEIEIKGRGNYTWRSFYKKPYKIKFAQKQSPLGLDRSKHFILMPHADDLSGYLRDETGFELSRRLGMEYTPTQKPVEVIINGEYIGLYFLCEKIRVESGRVNITEQQDNDMNPYNASGGWLLELSGDGTFVHGQFENNDTSRIWYWFASHSPENVSQVQIDYISHFISQTDSCIFVDDKTDISWENYLDVFSLSKFYVIHEVMSNVESFCRSMYVYKDWGEDEKLKFGPVWDFGNSFTFSGTDDFIYNYHTQFTYLWIKELVKFPSFRNAVLDVWNMFIKEDVLAKVIEHDHQLMATIEKAKQYDKVRWPFYGDSWSGASESYLTQISYKVAWLDKQWGDDSGFATIIDGEKHVLSVLYYNLQGVSGLEPFKGFNIKVTAYDDGTFKTEKMMR